MGKVAWVIGILFFCVSQGYAEDINGEWSREGQWGDATKTPELWNSPTWVLALVKEKQFDKKYKFITRLNPFYLRGDFNGDGRPDFAVLIERLSDKKQGIAVFHDRDSIIHVIGAGRSFGNGGDDFTWMDVWHVYPIDKVERGADEGLPPTLKGEAFLVEKSESASAIIYWQGKAYAWYQQGD